MPDTRAQRTRSLRSQTVGALKWQFLTVLLQAVLQLAVVVALARWLAPEDFGVFALCAAVVGILSLFTQLGVGSALVQRPGLTPLDVRTAFTLCAGLGALGSGIFWLAAPTISGWLAAPEAAAPMRLAGLAILLLNLGVVAQALMQRELRFRRLFVAEVASYAAGYAAVALALGWMGYGTWALVGALLGQALLKTILSFVLSPHRVTPVLDPRAYRHLLAYGGGLTGAQVANQAAVNGDNLLVGRFLGSSALGFYERAYFLMQMPGTYLGLVIDRVMFPALAQIQHDRRLLAASYLRVVALVAAIMAPLSAALMILAREVVLVVLGPTWLPSVPALQVLLACVMFRTCSRVGDSLARATGTVASNAVVKTGYAVAAVAGTLAGLPWGLVGVAFGVTAANILHFVAMTALSARTTGTTLRDFGLAMLPGARLAAVAALVSLPTALLLRALDAPPALVLAASCAATGSAFAALVWTRPSFFGEAALAARDDILDSFFRRKRVPDAFGSADPSASIPPPKRPSP